MVYRLRFLAVLCALALALCAAGCGGSSTGSASSQAQPTASASSSSSQAQPSASASSSSSQAQPQSQAALPDGTYTATFETDSSMFHVNEANDGKGTLTVSDGKMSIHVSLVSQKIVNVYAGTADQAKADSANVIEPTTDTVTYSDGYEEEVYGFDIPVPVLDEEFDVAILGESGKWFDHKVSVTDPVSE